MVGRQVMAIVAGAGALRQTRDGSYSGCDFGCFSGETATPQRTSLAWLAGIDHALRLAPHLDLAAGLRLHAMRRGSSTDALFQFANSTPLSVSLSLRLGS